ncbi:hypothetical protein V6O07_15755, partial [Arthrospira platensis SPKY2]
MSQLIEEFTDQIQLIFWGIRPPESLTSFSNVVWEPVAIGEYAAYASYFGQQECDIFIAPLEDNLFNRCKSGLKFLEYSALGVPGVYSHLEPYQDLVQHG